MPIANSNMHRALPTACFPELFELQAERTPEAEAVAYRDQHLSYSELNRRSNQMARYLRAAGVGPETLVGICMERAPEMMIGLLGILKAGGAYVPLDASYPTDRLAYMMTDAKANVILTQKRLVDRISGAGGKIVCIDENWPEIERQSASNVKNDLRQEHLAYVIYTSGSTGKPKGVMIHHLGLVNYLSWASRFYRMWEGRGTLVHSPIGFDLTITTLFGPLIVGQRVVLLPEGIGLDELAGALRSGRDYSVVKITPTHLEALAHMLPPSELAGRVRVLVIGGEMLRWEHIAAWRQHAPETRLVNEYGPTETVVGCCIYEVGEKIVGASVPIGTAIENMEMNVLDAELKPVAPGETGEIYIGGVGVARGYLNQPETTRAKFVTAALNGSPPRRLYKTGDLARALPDGNLEYLGRTDHQVKIRGYRIELGEIEVAMAQHPAVRDCVVLAREEDGDRRLVGYIVARDAQTPSFDELRTFLQERLPAYMVPTAFVTMDLFPLTVNGKIDRDALPPPADQQRSGEPFIAPTETLELQLAGIWQEVLGVRPISMTDNFFEIGGDSLKAVLMTTRVEEVRGRHIPPAMLLEENTIQKLARAIHKLDLEPHDRTIVPVQGKGYLPPLYLVPGIGGMVLGLSYLAQRLGSQQPVFGIQARGVKNSEMPCESIEEMAKYNIDAIRAVQPKGPYFIGGYSFGGVVAYEMARQLHAAGEQVGILAIFDTEAPGPQPFDVKGVVCNFPFWFIDFVLRRDPLEVAKNALAKLRSLAVQIIAKAVPPLGLPPPARRIEDEVEMPRDWPERYRRVIEIHYKALLAYQPAPYAGSAALFRTKAQPLLRAHGDNGWGRLVRGGVEVYHIDGRHMDFLVEPYVRSLATQLRIALEKCRNRMGIRPQPLARGPAGRDSSPEAAYSSSSESLRAARR